MILTQLIATRLCAQLDETWIVGAGGAFAPVQADGSFIIHGALDYYYPIRPEFGNAGGITPMRVIGYSASGGNVRGARSERFYLSRTGTRTVNQFELFYEPLNELVALIAILEAPAIVAGGTSRVRVRATYSDGHSQELGLADGFTVFHSSNPRIASVSENGLVTGLGAGVAYVMAFNGGATASSLLRVSAPTLPTTVLGMVVRSDGSPVSGARVRLTAGDSSTVSGPDGRFSLGNLLWESGSFQLRAEWDSGGQHEAGTSGLIEPVPGGFTDAGIIVIRPESSAQLAVGVDAEDRLWETEGDSPWSLVSTNSLDGIDAIQSGPLNYNEANSVSTTIQGPGYLSFAWQVHTGGAGLQPRFDAANSALTLFVNGREERRLTAPQQGGVGLWEQLVVLVPDGLHRVEWQLVAADIRWVDGLQYFCDITQDPGYPLIASYRCSVKGFLDQVKFSPLAVEDRAPILVVQPQHQLVSAGDFAEFSVGAIGFPEVTYQWQRDGTNLPNATTPKLQLRGTFVADSGSFVCLVSNRVGVVASRAAVLKVIAPPALGQSVDAPQLQWTTGGDAPWFSQVRTTTDGLHAAQSGEIHSCGESWIETVIEGPATVCFRWRVSSKAHSPFLGTPKGDVLKLLVDGVENARIGGDVYWARKSIVIPAGNHRLRWIYSKDPSGRGLLDTAWLDGVTLNECGPSLSEAAFALTGEWEPRLRDWIPQALPLLTGGNAPWLTNNPPINADVIGVRSGAIENFGNSWIESTLQGPGSLSFGWAVTSQTNADYLSFTQDASEERRISGQTAESPVQHSVPEGIHRLRWTYQKDEAIASGGDRGLLAVVALVRPEDGNLGEALDAPQLGWGTASARPWGYQTRETHDGKDAAGNSSLPAGEASWIETTVLGPASVSFDWRIVGSGNLELAVDGVTIASAVPDWSTFTLTISAGMHEVRWTCRAGSTELAANRAVLDLVRVVSFPQESVPLAEALNQADWRWVTSSNAPWNGQRHESRDSSASAQSGVLRSVGSSWIETTIAGPGTLQFWWKVSDTTLSVSTNGSQALFRDARTQGTSWDKAQIVLPPGQHVIRWTTLGIYGGQPAAWLDEVSFINPADSAPQILLQPLSRNVDERETVTFEIAVSGFPVPAIQWFFNEAPLAGATSPRLVLSNVLPSQSGRYMATVTNRLGSVTSEVATLTVLSTIDEALGSPGLSWSTGGNQGTGWVPTEFFSGRTAMITQRLTDRGTAWLQTEVSGPAVLTFDTRVDSVAGGDTLTVYLDGVSTLGPIFGNRSEQFTTRTMFVPTGKHVVRWEYVESGGTISAFYDIALLSQVSVTPASTPEVVSLSTNLIVLEGSETTLRIQLSGVPTPFTTWRLDGHPISFPDTTTTNWHDFFAQKSDSGVYSVVASNFVGTAEIDVARLTVLTLGEVVEAPTNYFNWRTFDFVGAGRKWTLDSELFREGDASLRSGSVNEGFSRIISTLEASVQGPGVITFWWRANLPRNTQLSFETNGVSALQKGSLIDDSTFDWRPESVPCPAGLHSLRWVLFNSSRRPDPPTAWLDQVTFTPSP